jgi:hypothetical protein
VYTIKETIEKTKGKIKNGQSRDTDNIGFKIQDGENQEWTIQRYRQHWIQETGRGKSRMDNPKTQTTLDSRYRTGKIKNGQSRDTDNIGFKIQDGENQEWIILRHRQHWIQDTGRGKSRMDNPETQITLDSRYRTGKIKNGQSRDTDNNGFKIQDGENQEWTIQRHRQQWIQDTGQRQTNKQTLCSVCPNTSNASK